MITSSFSFPCSLDELNTCLENCQDSKHLAKILGFEDLERGKITMELFIKTIVYPLESYSDVTSEKLKVLLIKMERLFPGQMAKEVDAVKFFWQKMKQKLIPSLPVESSVYEGRLYLDATQTVPLAFTEKEYLTEAVKNLALPIDCRFNIALQLTDISSQEKKAWSLQLMLNLLIGEHDLFEVLNSYTDVAFQEQKVAQLFRKGCHSIIRLSVCREATLFEFPSSIEDSTEFAFWLNLCPYLDFRKEGDRLSVCFKPIERWCINPKEIEAKLTLLKAQTNNERILFLIDKVFLIHQQDILHKKIFQEIKKIITFNSNLKKSLLVQQKYPEPFEILLTPLSYLLCSYLNKHLIKMASEGLRDIPIEDIENFKHMIELWKNYQEKQKELFALAYAQLDQIVQHSTSKRRFFQYTKSLFVSAGEQALSLRNSLNEEKLPSVPLPILEEQSKIKQGKQSSQQVNLSSSKTQKHGKKSSPPQLSPLPVVVPFPLAPTPSTTENPEKIAQPLKKIEKTMVVAELPGKPFPYQWDMRVERWHQHPRGMPLPDLEFPEYQDISLNYQELMHVFHALHPLVDRFLSLGIQGTWINSQNKEVIRIAIAAEIIFKSKKRRGWIVYAIDPKTSVCYHKFFSEKFEADILQQVISQTFNENDFPELQKAVLSSRSKPTLIQAMTANIIIDPIFGNVTIEDREQALSIKLFKTCE